MERRLTPTVPLAEPVSGSGLVWSKLTPPTPRAGLIARPDQLHVSVNTIRSQVQAIYRKLEVTGRAEAVTRGAPARPALRGDGGGHFT